MLVTCFHVDIPYPEDMEYRIRPHFITYFPPATLSNFWCASRPAILQGMSYMRFILPMAFVLNSLLVFSQDTGYLFRPPVSIQKVQGQIKLDGLSDEPAWQQATRFDYITLEPVYKAPPSYRTELLVTFDDQFIYVAGRCYDDEPGKIIARNLVRDGWRGDDWFTFHIDAAGDKQNAVVFSVYPLGSRYDLSTANDAIELGGNTFNTYFNMIWEAKTAITDKGWFLEMKIPFSILRFRVKEGKAIMGISSTRACMRKNEFHQFPAVPQNAYDPIMQPSVKQQVVFENFKASPFYNIAPSLIVNWQQLQQLNLQQNTYSPQSKLKPNASLDIKYGLTPTLTLDATVNTDFAQAEADQQQFNLSRSSIFYPERRFFFQEQAGYYDFNSGTFSQLFYSRRIGLQDGAIIPVLGGLRLTGKAGPWDIGALNIQTQQTTIDDSVYIPTENFGVMRVRRKVFNNNSYAGGIITSRFNNRSHNFAGGFDAMIRVKGDQYLTAAIAKTFDKGREYNNFFSSGMARLLYELRRTDKWFYKAGYNYLGKEYNPAVGFVARQNIHELFGMLMWGKFPKSKTGLFKYARIQFGGDSYWNTVSNKLESWNGNLNFRGIAFNGYSYEANLDHYYEYLADTLRFSDKIIVPNSSYSFVNLKLNYSAPSNPAVKTALTITTGTFYDGWRNSGNLSATFNINKFFEVETGYNLEYIQFKKRKIEEPVHIVRLRLGMATDLHLSGSIQTQYNSSIDKTLLNARMRYNFRDGHDIYLVYNEVVNNNRFIYQPKLPLVNEQQVLLKYVYTFY